MVDNYLPTLTLISKPFVIKQLKERSVENQTQSEPLLVKQPMISYGKLLPDGAKAKQTKAEQLTYHNLVSSVIKKFVTTLEFFI